VLGSQTTTSVRCITYNSCVSVVLIEPVSCVIKTDMVCVLLEPVSCVIKTEMVCVLLEPVSCVIKTEMVCCAD